MNYYKATIQYDGTDYCGFQWQKDLRTIQNDFNQSLYKLMTGKITTMGASRTDTGVHAVEQFVKISSENEIECTSFLVELNRVLPSQLRCLSLNSCESHYRPASDSSSKEYRYLFTNFEQSNPTDQRFIVNHPYPLNVDRMRECAQLIVGQHDFRNFYSAGSNVKTTIREISICDITEVVPRKVLPQSDLFVLPPNLETCYQLKIEGNGFLKQMVRHLMRALWLAGGGKISSDEFSLLLNGPLKTDRLWKVASPNGLYLYRFRA